VSTRRIRLLAAAMVSLPLVAYPAAVVAHGAPRFHSRSDCVRIAPVGSTEELDLVFGRRNTPAAADALLRRVTGVGYVDATMRIDACGRWEVLYDRIESYPQGASSAAQARGAGLQAHLELAPPG
jgi:hypothetical protein